MVERLLLIEDDSRLAEMLSEYLGQAGFGVTVAALGAAALKRLTESEFDAVILDLMLPDMDGLDVCRQIRARNDTPVLMLTARGEAIDRIVGLELGADDYLPKPFEPRELLARLRAVLRRRERGATTGHETLRFGRLEIDIAARAVRLDRSGWKTHRCHRSAAATTGRNAPSPAEFSALGRRRCVDRPPGRWTSTHRQCADRHRQAAAGFPHHVGISSGSWRMAGVHLRLRWPDPPYRHSGRALSR